MVFPIGDDNSDRKLFPIVTTVIIAINVFVFVVFQGMGQNEAFTYSYSCVPEEIVTGRDIDTSNQPPVPVTDPHTGQVVVDPQTHEPVYMPRLGPTWPSVYITLLTSIFMHGSLMHIGGNMWFLWIFGDNVEDDMGHGRYTAFYLLTGLIASLSHVFVSLGGPSAEVPSLGASGAISGVMGGYLVLHPQRQVRVIMFRVLTVVPGYVAVGLWFLFQIISSLSALGGSGDGVAYAAHIGGFIAGAVLAKPFTIGRELREPVPVYRGPRGWN